MVGATPVAAWTCVDRPGMATLHAREHGTRRVGTVEMID